MVKEEIGILDEGNGKGREMISVVNMGMQLHQKWEKS